MGLLSWGHQLVLLLLAQPLLLRAAAAQRQLQQIESILQMHNPSTAPPGKWGYKASTMAADSEDMLAMLQQRLTKMHHADDPAYRHVVKGASNVLGVMKPLLVDAYSACRSGAADWLWIDKHRQLQVADSPPTQPPTSPATAAAPPAAAAAGPAACPLVDLLLPPISRSVAHCSTATMLMWLLGARVIPGLPEGPPQVGCQPHRLAPADIPSSLLLKFFKLKQQQQQPQQQEEQQQRRRALNLLLLPLEGLPNSPQSGDAVADTGTDSIQLAAAFQLSDLLLCPDEECQQQLAEEVKEGGTRGKVLLLPPLSFLEPRWWLPPGDAKPPKRHQLLVTLPLDSGANALAQEVLTCWGRHLRSNSSAPPFVLTIMGMSPSWQLPAELVGLLEQQANLQQQVLGATQQQQQQQQQQEGGPGGKPRHLLGAENHAEPPHHHISSSELSGSWQRISRGLGGRLRRLLHLRRLTAAAGGPSLATAAAPAAGGGSSDNSLAAVMRPLMVVPPMEGAAWQEGWKGPWLRLLPAWHGVAARSGNAHCRQRRANRQLTGPTVSPCPLQTRAALRLAQERAHAGVHVCLTQRVHTQQQQEEAAGAADAAAAGAEQQAPAHVEVERCALPALASAALVVAAHQSAPEWLTESPAALLFERTYALRRTRQQRRRAARTLQQQEEEEQEVVEGRETQSSFSSSSSTNHLSLRLLQEEEQQQQQQQQQPAQEQPPQLQGFMVHHEATEEQQQQQQEQQQQQDPATALPAGPGEQQAAEEVQVVTTPDEQEESDPQLLQQQKQQLLLKQQQQQAEQEGGSSIQHPAEAVMLLPGDAGREEQEMWGQFAEGSAAANTARALRAQHLCQALAVAAVAEQQPEQLYERRLAARVEFDKQRGAAVRAVQALMRLLLLEQLEGAEGSGVRKPYGTQAGGMGGQGQLL